MSFFPSKPTRVISSGGGGSSISDLTTSTTTVWSSNKVNTLLSNKASVTSEHTHSNKVTIDKLSENVNGKLVYNGSDVNINNINDLSSSVNTTYSSSKIDGLLSSSSGAINQLTKLGVVASSTTPRVTNILIPNTENFSRSKIEVLKFTASQTNQIVTVATFDNSSVNDFQPDPLNQVQFSTTSMYLKTSFLTALTNNGPLGSSTLLSSIIDKSLFKTIESVGVI